ENDDPVEGVRVDNDITSATTNAAGYVSSFTDSDGGFILTGITTNVTLMATKYGYTFTNVGWDNPLTSSVANIRFLATLVTNVGLRLSTHGSAENGPGAQFSLTRSDSSSNALAVALMVSGSAGVPSAIFFNPPLTNGLNMLVIPSGTNRVTFSFTPV